MATETVEKFKVKATPKLRFKEFEEFWRKKLLGEIADFYKGRSISKADIKEEGEIECIRYGELYTYYQEVIIEIKSKTNLPKKDLVLSKKNDVIIPASGETHLDIATAACVLKDNVALGGDLNIIRANSNGVFLAYYLNNRKKLEIARLSQGNSVVHLYSKQLKFLNLNLPNSIEQRKIASFLSAVDEKIQQLTRKKELLETYKKGVMQKLFSQEIRFKDEEGRDFPEWKKKKFGEVYSFLTTNSFSRNDLNYEEGSVKNIHYGDIHTKFLNLFHLAKENVPFINSDKDISKINPENFCQEGDLVIADASEDYKDIGKTIEIIDINGEKVLAGLHTFLARPKSNIMYKGFSGYLVQNWSFRKQVMTIAQGTKVLGLSTGRMNKLRVEIPSIPEQQKIAEFLSVIDKKTEAVSQQIEKTQTFKKGLLQQMFV